MRATGFAEDRRYACAGRTPRLSSIVECCLEVSALTRGELKLRPKVTIKMEEDSCINSKDQILSRNDNLCGTVHAHSLLLESL